MPPKPSQRNPMRRYESDDESASAPVSLPTSQHANGHTSEPASPPASPPVSESARKQEDKPTKSYRLDRELAFQFMLWARTRHLTESAAIERAIRLLMSQED